MPKKERKSVEDSDLDMLSNMQGFGSAGSNEAAKEEQRKKEEARKKKKKSLLDTILGD